MKTKIVIVGIGGVGGYYGGLLAREYENNDSIDIYFIARGEHLKEIQNNGLTVKTEKETFVVRPFLATDKAGEIGTADYIVFNTKSYDLDSTIEQIKPCIDKNTVLLPLLNGISITPSIRKLLPENEIWYGCVYIVGRLLEPGVVGSFGNVHDMYFGSDKGINNKLLFFNKVLLDAGIDAHLEEDILYYIWKKFFFISATASLTSYFDVSFGALLTDENRKNTLYRFLTELLTVAHAEGVNIDERVIDNTIQRIQVLPFDTTSSMHSDFQAGRRTEVETLTGVVLSLAEKHGITLPTYNKVYNALIKKSAGAE